MKKKILFAFIFLLSIAVFTGCGCKKKEKDVEPDIKVNTEEDVVKDQEVDGIKLTNTSLVITDGVSKLTTQVTNDTDSDYELDEYTIIIKDKDDKEIIRIPGYVGNVIKAGETRTINSSVDIDLSNAKSIEYEVKK
jgi:hypothetical protein